MSSNYTYTGKRLETREVGIKAMLRPQYDEVCWRRWSEWGDVFPEESISRIASRAKAHRGKQWPNTPANVRPTWPWSLDETAPGHQRFPRDQVPRLRRLIDGPPTAQAFGVHSDANVHFRPCLAENGVTMHVLSQCTLAPVVLKKGSRLTTQCTMELIGHPGRK